MDKKARVDVSDDKDSKSSSSDTRAEGKSTKCHYRTQLKKIWTPEALEFLDPKSFSNLTQFEVGKQKIILHGDIDVMIGNSQPIADQLRDLSGSKPPYVLFPEIDMDYEPLLIAWLWLNDVSIRCDDTSDIMNEGLSIRDNLQIINIAYDIFQEKYEGTLVNWCVNIIRYFMANFEIDEDTEGKDVVEFANGITVEALSSEWPYFELAIQIHERPKLAALATFIPIKYPRSLQCSSINDDDIYIERADLTDLKISNVMKRLSEHYVINGKEIIIRKEMEFAVRYYHCYLRKEENAVVLEPVYVTMSRTCPFLVGNKACGEKLEAWKEFCHKHRDLTKAPSYAMEMD